VVIAILGILAGIAAPSAIGWIDHYNRNEYIRRATLVEDTIMSLTGLQYAKSTTGSPAVGGTSTFPPFVSDPVVVSDYVTIYNQSITLGSAGTVYALAPSNEGSNNSSVGLKELYNRTLVALDPFALTESTTIPPAYVYVQLKGSSPNLTDKNLDFSLVGSVYFIKDNSTNILVLHGCKLALGASIPSNGILTNLDFDPDSGWHVYRVNGTSVSEY
jgi:type II secretory pathway pseudopilin PulG